MKYTHAFSGFSVRDAEETVDFYGQKLGLDVSQDKMGITLKLPGGAEVFLYPKQDHQAASYTVLNLIVENIDASIEELVSSGIEFIHYDNLPSKQDAKGVLRGKAAGMGPDIAWFTDPSGNVIGLLEN